MITNKEYKKYINSINKSYSEKFKFIRYGSIIFSFFGNIASVFFAFFFFLSIFSRLMFDVNSSWINIGVVLFLLLFEYLKRYVFDLFSIEILKKIKLTKQKIFFLITTIIMISFSFFFSLNGAQKLVNNETNIEKTINTNIKSQVDSINNYYMTNYISKLNKENDNIINQKSNLTEQQSQLINRGWNTSKISNQIKTLDKQLLLNKQNIEKYENEKNNKIIEIKSLEKEKLNKEQNKNTINIFYFLFLSSIIEIIIIAGVFYNRYYEFRTIKEYEEKTVNTLSYKNWKKFSIILEIIFSSDIKINEYLPSSKSIMETIEINDYKITQKELINCLKTFNYLSITETKGPKRILRMSKSDAEISLKKYFKIK